MRFIRFMPTCIGIFLNPQVCSRHESCFLETILRLSRRFVFRDSICTLRENYRPDKPRFARADILSLNTDVTATATRESAVHVYVRACVHATHTHAKCSSRQLPGNAGDSGHSKPALISLFGRVT